MSNNDNAEKLMTYCEIVLELNEEQSAMAMALASATLAGNESNLLNLISTMIKAFHIINDKESNAT